MKKFSELVKPYLTIIFGTILFLIYLNYLSLQGLGLALGIIAVIISAYCIGIGVVGVILGDKLPKLVRKIFEIVTIDLFALLMFLYLLFIPIQDVEGMGPTSWVIVIIGMIGALALMGLYPFVRLFNNKLLTRFGYLAAAIFILVLLLDMLFNIYNGFPNVLGNISMVELAIYVIYSIMLMNSFANNEEVEEKHEEESSKEPAPIEEPAEEADSDDIPVEDPEEK